MFEAITPATDAEGLPAQGDIKTGIFRLLRMCPSAQLPRSARSALFRGAYMLDGSQSIDSAERVVIREWLARMATEADMIGPLVGVEWLSRA